MTPYGADLTIRNKGETVMVEPTLVILLNQISSWATTTKSTQVGQCTFPPIAVRLRWMGHPSVCGWLEEDHYKDKSRSLAARKDDN